jgi:hypothetical protein
LEKCFDDGITTRIAETGRGAHNAQGKMSVHAAARNGFEFVGRKPALNQRSFIQRNFLHHGNHFEIVPSASIGGKTVLQNPFSQ